MELIAEIKQCIASEIECMHNINQYKNSIVKTHFLIETNKSIKIFNDILTKLTMPKLSVNCKFKSAGNRTFRVVGMGWDGESDCWQIQEYQEVKHEDVKQNQLLGEPFFRTKKEMSYAIDMGKIIIM